MAGLAGALQDRRDVLRVGDLPAFAGACRAAEPLCAVGFAGIRPSTSDADRRAAEGSRVHVILPLVLPVLSAFAFSALIVCTSNERTS